MELDFRALLAEERKKAVLKSSDTRSVEVKEIKHDRDKVNRDATGYLRDASSKAFEFLHIDNLDAYKLRCDYESIFYIPNYIDAATEEAILSCVDKSPWTLLKTRRLQHHCSLQQPLPDYLQVINDSIVSSGIFSAVNQPNHVLINDYRSNEGILHHVDGPSYYPKVAILSMLSHCLMTFRPNLTSAKIGEASQDEIFSVYLEPRSLLVFDQEIYTHLQHGIHADTEECVLNSRIPCLNNSISSVTRGVRRTSLTIRKMYSEGEM